MTHKSLTYIKQYFSARSVLGNWILSCLFSCLRYVQAIVNFKASYCGERPSPPTIKSEKITAVSEESTFDKDWAGCYPGSAPWPGLLYLVLRFFTFIDKDLMRGRKMQPKLNTQLNGLGVLTLVKQPKKVWPRDDPSSEQCKLITNDDQVKN